MKYIELKDLNSEFALLNDKSRKTKADKARLKEVQAAINERETFLEEARLQRKAIRDEIGTYSEP